MDRLVVGVTECLQSLVTLLAVVETWCHRVDAKEGVGHEFGLGPLAGGKSVGAGDMAVDWEGLAGVFVSY